MATVSTLIPFVPTYRPYERPSDPAALWTAIPRGLRGGVVQLSGLPVKPLNDDQTLDLSLTLSTSFAYVFAEIGLRITQDVALAWDSEYALTLTHWFQGLLNVPMTWNFDFAVNNFTQTARGQGHTALDTVPKAPMWAPSSSSGIDVNVHTFNAQDPAGGVGTVAAFINFWEFDLEQVRKFPINAPIPTHSR